MRWPAAAVVICDRYLASSVAYGEAQGLDAVMARPTRSATCRSPTLTVLLDIAPETAARRKAAGRDRFERDLALLGRVRASYLRQATAPEWVRIDGERRRDEVEAAAPRVIGTTRAAVSALHLARARRRAARSHRPQASRRSSDVVHEQDADVPASRPSVAPAPATGRRTAVAARTRAAGLTRPRTGERVRARCVDAPRASSPA